MCLKLIKNPKAKGSRIERKAIEELSRQYYCVKSGGSLGVFDIIALAKQPALQLIKLIQVKTWRDRNVVSEALQELKSLPLPTQDVFREVWLENKNKKLFILEEVNQYNVGIKNWVLNFRGEVLAFNSPEYFK